MADRNPAVAPAWRRIAAAAGQIWCGATGAQAYDAYLRHHARAHPGEPPLGRGQFERRAAERRYEGISRCC